MSQRSLWVQCYAVWFVQCTGCIPRTYVNRVAWLQRFCHAYLDDILIFSETFEEHMLHLNTIFERLYEHGLRLKLKKCSFLQHQVNYRGFVIDQDGIKPDQKKVEAIRALPVPTCVKEVRSFVGMCSYYRRFIPNFSQIAEPIIDLTRKYA